MPECVVAFIDLLGFKQACRAGRQTAVEMLSDYQAILQQRLLDQQMDPPSSYANPNLRRIAERISAGSFESFIPASDSIFILSSDPSNLVFQLSHFIADVLHLSAEHCAYPENPANPREVTWRNYTVNSSGISMRPEAGNHEPVLFRGGIDWGEARSGRLPGILSGEKIPAPAVVGPAVVNAVGLERTGKGPRVWCSRAFAEQLTPEAREWVCDPIEACGAPDTRELLWPMALFETASDLGDACLNRFGHTFRIALNLWKYQSDEYRLDRTEDGVLRQYVMFLRLLAATAIRRYPDSREDFLAFARREMETANAFPEGTPPEPELAQFLGIANYE